MQLVDSPATARGRRLGARWLVGFVLLFGVVGLWSLATPRYAAPDEPAHAVKAAATVRGELVGHHPPSSLAAVIRFKVPKTIARGTDPGCFAFKPQVSAGCARPWRSYSGDVSADSYVGRYPPLYYAAVGTPSLLTRNSSVLLWMRLVSAAAAAAFLAGAFVAASLMPRPRLMIAGVAVAMTPTAIFLGSVINPNGLEIASALCLWVSGLALVTEAGAAHRRWLLAWTVVSAAVMVQMRGLSPVLLAVILLTLAFVAERGRLRALVQEREARIGAAVIAACGVFAVVWIATRGSLKVKPVSPPVPRSVSSLSLFRTTLQHVGLNTRQPVGVFGWLDTTMPVWTYYVWNIAVVALLGVAVWAGVSRALIAALATVGVSILLPTVVAFSQAHKLGIDWQSRYILPVAVGIPVLLGYAASRREWNIRWLPIALLAAMTAIAAVHISAFVQTLHRYRTGVLAPIWTSHASWSPPITWWVCIALFIAFASGLVGWWYSLGACRPSTRLRSGAVR